MDYRKIYAALLERFFVILVGSGINLRFCYLPKKSPKGLLTLRGSAGKNIGFLFKESPVWVPFGATEHLSGR